MAHDLIPPELRARLKGLVLVSRHAAGGHGIGLHASRSRGAGLEFAQYRAYEPGDELRQVDWTLYARSDKFFVREAERESPLTLWIVLDASGSMGLRLLAARTLAAALAELAIAGSDRFGLIVLAEQGLSLVPAGTGARARDRLLLALRDVAPGGGFPAEAALAPLWERIGARDLVAVVSDWFEPALLDTARKLSAAGREVLAIQLLTPEERDFPFDGGHRFRDPETGEELLVDAPAMRADYLRRFAEAQGALRAQLEGAGVRHVAYTTDEPLDAPLRVLFG